MTRSYGQSWYSLRGFKGRVEKWCPSDHEMQFNTNMADPAQRALLEEYGWTRDNVSYTFNKDGFRADEFTYEPNDSVLFLGCSLTVGIGVDLESSWAYKVASRLGLRCYNLGTGAGSADTCFRLAYHWIPLLRPKYVMMLTPPNARIEIVEDRDIIQLLPQITQFSNKKYVEELIEEYYKPWLAHPANADMNRLKNVMGVQTICNGIGVPLVEIPTDKMYDSKTMMTKGRDLLHPGREWNEYVAQTFMKKLSDLPKIGA